MTARLTEAIAQKSVVTPSSPDDDHGIALSEEDAQVIARHALQYAAKLYDDEEDLLPFEGQHA